MRTWLTRAVVAGVVGLVVAVLVTELRPPEPAEGEPRSPGRTTPAPLPPCSREQLALSIEVLGGSGTAVLRHVRGKPCRLARVPVDLRVLDRAGKRVGLSYSSDPALAGNFFPDFERLLGITYLPTCAARGPYTAIATVGSYSARGKLSGREVGCFTGG
jgi:hypothetical protein